MDPFLYHLVSVYLSSLPLPLSLLPTSQVSSPQGGGREGGETHPQCPMMATGLGGREEIRSLVPWGPSQKARVGQTAGPGLTGPSVPSPRPQGPRGTGLRNLRAAPGRTHPAGEARSLPAAPCCHLVASAENSTLLPRPSPESAHWLPLPGPVKPRPPPPPKNNPSWQREDSRASYRCQPSSPLPVSPTLGPGWLCVCLEPGGEVPLHLRDRLHLPGSLSGKEVSLSGCHLPGPQGIPSSLLTSHPSVKRGLDPWFPKCVPWNPTWHPTGLLLSGRGGGGGGLSKSCVKEKIILKQNKP